MATCHVIWGMEFSICDLLVLSILESFWILRHCCCYCCCWIKAIQCIAGEPGTLRSVACLSLTPGEGPAFPEPFQREKTNGSLRGVTGCHIALPGPCVTAPGICTSWRAELGDLQTFHYDREVPGKVLSSLGLRVTSSILISPSDPFFFNSTDPLSSALFTI